MAYKKSCRQVFITIWRNTKCLVLDRRIAVLGRFAADTSVTRYAAVVNAHRLLEAVWVAGGEPVTLLPVKESNWQERLNGLSGVLMPGGSDINPTYLRSSPRSCRAGSSK